MLNCQISQFYEWLPWEKHIEINPNAMSWQDKIKYLNENWNARYIRAANEARQLLVETYGDAGNNVRYAECFELSPYGRQVSVQEFRSLFQ